MTPVETFLASIHFPPVEIIAFGLPEGAELDADPHESRVYYGGHVFVGRGYPTTSENTRKATGLMREMGL